MAIDKDDTRSAAPALDRRTVMRVLAGSTLLPLGAAPLAEAFQSGPCGGTFDFKVVRFYESFAAGNWDAIRADLAADVVLKVPFSFPLGGTYKGPDRVVVYLKRAAKRFTIHLNGVGGFGTFSLADHGGIATDQGGCNSAWILRFNADGFLKEGALFGLTTE
jgi:SnoaL-like domain